MNNFLFYRFGGAFALMWGNIQSINEDMDQPKPKPRHPEAPESW